MHWCVALSRLNIALSKKSNFSSSIPIREQAFFACCKEINHFGHGQTYRHEYLLGCAIGIASNKTVFKPHYLQAYGLHIFVALPVVHLSYASVVCIAVNLYNKTQFVAVEVGNIMQDRLLANEFILFAQFLQHRPQIDFGLCAVVAELACHLHQVGIVRREVATELESGC